MKFVLQFKGFVMLFSVLLLWPFQEPAFGQTGSKPNFLLDKSSLSISENKISSNIRRAIQKLNVHGVTLFNSQSKAAASFSSRMVKIDNFANIQSYIYLSDTSPEHLAALEQQQIKIEIVNEEWGIVQAWVPFTRFNDIAQLDFVTRIAPPDYAITFTGSVTTEGDAVLRADDVRNTLGITGAGVRVGVISDGVDSRAQAQASDDLPANIEIHLAQPGSGDEGTAMLEIVHDLAPGAQLAFSGPGTSLEMVNSINFLSSTAFGGAGCEIVVDDLGFLTQPAFQDGLLAQTANQVVANGVTYITAAGNQAGEHYERNYVAGTFPVGNQQIDAHDFGAAAGGSSDPTLRVTVGAGGNLTVILHWNDPSPGSGNDYDLLVFDAAVDTVLATGEDVQNGNDFPLEFAEFENQSASAILADVVVRNFQASQRLLEIFFAGDGFEVEEHNISEGSIAPGHQAATGAITVGAIFVLDSGNDTIEFFSSRGPARIFFPSSQERLKPDLASVDGGVITGAGGFGQEFPSGSGDIRFFGTSAAAPHAAGVAALILDANPNLTPAQVRDALMSAAVDLGAPGADNTFGAGRIDAFEAVQFVTAVEDDDSNLPTQFSLAQNYPNPFNPSTLIRYTLPANSEVILEIFNLLGQKIRTLVNRRQAAGAQQVEWDGKNDVGKLAASGVYLYRLQAGSFVDMKKMVSLQ